MTAYGIDVCSYQGIIDWYVVKDVGCQFAVLKCIRKDLNPDTAFARNVEGCRANQIPISCYTYVYEGDVAGAKQRAKAAVKACRAQGLDGCTIWWDVEDECLRNVATSQNKKNALNESIREARKVIEEAGFGFGVYCDMDFQAACLYPSKLGVRWWIAKYGKNPDTKFRGEPSTTKPTTIGKLCGWQYCSRGRVRGFYGYVDLDIAYQDSEQQTGQARNPHTFPKAIVTSNKRAAYSGLQKWIPRGSQVKAVQWELQRLGYNLGDCGIDGVCGAATVRAIEAFQRRAGLTVDGLCGPKTWAALKAA